MQFFLIFNFQFFFVSLQSKFYNDECKTGKIDRTHVKIDD